MITRYIIWLFLKLYSYYEKIYQLIFNWINNITIIYHISESKIKNITLNYYTGINLIPYSKGTFYTKTYHKYGSDHIAFNGNLNNITKLHRSISTNNLDNNPKRKYIITLLNNDKPINFNLQILDNYMKNVIFYGNNAIINLNDIFKYLGVECTHLNLTNINPFFRKTINIDKINLNELYIF